MIFGIGVDIVEVSRFAGDSWDENKIKRFFNQAEIYSGLSEQAKAEYYAARYGAKEAFGKALGTGMRGFSLTEVYVSKDNFGKPELVVEGKAAEILKQRAGESKIHLSLSHEHNYAVAYLLIEKLS